MDWHDFNKLLRMLEGLEREAARRRKVPGADRGGPTLATARERRKSAEGGRPEGAARDGFTT